MRENDYTRSYNNSKYLYDLTKLDTTTSIVNAPNYDNIKNDFYVWGERETTEGVKVAIRYHLVIDKKPFLHLATKNFYEVYTYVTTQIDLDTLVAKLETVDETLAQDVSETELSAVPTKIIIRYDSWDDYRGTTYVTDDGYHAILIGTPCDEWREELYR